MAKVQTLACYLRVAKINLLDKAHYCVSMDLKDQSVVVGLQVLIHY